MLCHCVTWANRHRYTEQIEQMHRQRHEVFVEQLGWKELRRPDERDIDEYDTDDSVYLLVLNDNGDVVASGRLNPSWARNQFEDASPLREKFAALPPPNGPKVWEGSRLLGGLPHRYGKDFARATLGILLAAGQEFGVRRGITGITSIFEAPALSRLQSIGWETDPLGLSTTYETDHGKGQGIAVVWKTDTRHLIRTRQAFGIAGPVLFEAAPVFEDADTEAPVYSLLNMAAELGARRMQDEGIAAMRAILNRAPAPEQAKRAV